MSPGRTARGCLKSLPMADIVPAHVRSRMMSGIRSKDTKPELMLRRALHARGLRYRLHDRRLPGTPDLVFPGRRATLQVHGCFWHGHDCHLFRLPGTRPEFWEAKIERNRETDARSSAALAALGWRQAVVWECAVRGRTRLPLGDVVSQCEDWIRGGDAGLVLRGN
jgi:DNA mismatch endonuclease, patch repair protein